ncbi:MAG: hypothetical protein NDI73_03340 [Desulfuromonadales bacterium]|nr:hypothetical protein [Desulfuromonadales bacterium]
MITEAEIDKGLVTLKVIWFAMLFSLVVYLLVAMQVGDTVKVSMEPKVVEILRGVFYVFSFVILFVTKFIRKMVLSAKGRSANRPAQSLSHPVLQKYITSMMISLALSESIGIFGFVLFLLGKNALDLYVLIAISAAAMFIYRPKKDELVSLAQEEQMKAAIDGTAG